MIDGGEVEELGEFIQHTGKKEGFIVASVFLGVVLVCGYKSFVDTMNTRKMAKENNSQPRFSS